MNTGMMPGFPGQSWVMTPSGEMFPEEDALHRRSSPGEAFKTAVEIFCKAARRAAVADGPQPIIVCLDDQTARDVAELAQDFLHHEGAIGPEFDSAPTLFQGSSEASKAWPRRLHIGDYVRYRLNGCRPLGASVPLSGLGFVRDWTPANALAVESSGRLSLVRPMTTEGGREFKYTVELGYASEPDCTHVRNSGGPVVILAYGDIDRRLSGEISRITHECASFGQRLDIVYDERRFPDIASLARELGLNVPA